MVLPGDLKGGNILIDSQFRAKVSGVSLRACYACPVLTYCMVLRCYAVSGTDIPYGAASATCVAMSGTNLLYAATRLWYLHVWKTARWHPVLDSSRGTTAMPLLQRHAVLTRTMLLRRYVLDAPTNVCSTMRSTDTHDSPTITHTTRSYGGVQY
eukprot:3292309-Rhodomonas_salina.5